MKRLAWQLWPITAENSPVGAIVRPRPRTLHRKAGWEGGRLNGMGGRQVDTAKQARRARARFVYNGNEHKEVGRGEERRRKRKRKGRRGSTEKRTSELEARC